MDVEIFNQNWSSLKKDIIKHKDYFAKLIVGEVIEDNDEQGPFFSINFKNSSGDIIIHYQIYLEESSDARVLAQKLFTTAVIFFEANGKTVLIGSEL